MDKITLYYFNIPFKVTCARGENVKLLLEDAGLEHEYVRLQRDETWLELKAKLMKEGAYSCTLPYIEVGGQKYFRTIPILRYISAKLDNKYHGSTLEENQKLDAIAEVTDLWADSFKNYFFGTEEHKKHHIDVETPEHLDKFEKYYSDREGPYILGDKITFPDFLVYHLIDDDMARDRLGNYPNLTKFVEAFEERPNIKKYLASLQQE